MKKQIIITNCNFLLVTLTDPNVVTDMIKTVNLIGYKENYHFTDSYVKSTNSKRCCLIIYSDEKPKVGNYSINLKSIHDHFEFCTIDNDTEYQNYALSEFNNCMKVVAISNNFSFPNLHKISREDILSYIAQRNSLNPSIPTNFEILIEKSNMTIKKENTSIQHIQSKEDDIIEYVNSLSEDKRKKLLDILLKKMNISFHSSINSNY